MSKFQLKISQYWNDCPNAWRNMILHLDRKENLDQYGDIKNPIINLELQSVQGAWDDRSSIIEFANEESYIQWLFKWS